MRACSRRTHLRRVRSTTPDMDLAQLHRYPLAIGDFHEDRARRPGNTAEQVTISPREKRATDVAAAADRMLASRDGRSTKARPDSRVDSKRQPGGISGL